MGAGERLCDGWIFFLLLWMPLTHRFHLNLGLGVFYLFSTWVLGLGEREGGAPGLSLGDRRDPASWWRQSPGRCHLPGSWLQFKAEPLMVGRFGHLMMSERLPESRHLRKNCCGCWWERVVFLIFPSEGKVLKTRKRNTSKKDGDRVHFLFYFSTDLYHIISILCS